MKGKVMATTLNTEFVKGIRTLTFPDGTRCGIIDYCGGTHSFKFLRMDAADKYIETQGPWRSNSEAADFDALAWAADQ